MELDFPLLTLFQKCMFLDDVNENLAKKVIILVRVVSPQPEGVVFDMV